jgi:SPP1 family predicted phage head-tail adaptor
MDAGAMDRRLAILQPTETTNSSNEAVQTFAVLTTVWAEKHDISDGEKLRAQEVGSSITTRFRIRWSEALSAMTPKWRVRLKGRTTAQDRDFEVTGLKEINRREGLEITATARTDQVKLYE